MNIPAQLNQKAVTVKTIRQFLTQFEPHITHYIVAQTNIRTYMRAQNAIDRDVELLNKKVRHFRNCFNQALYAAKAKRKPLKWQPLLITTIEGVATSAEPTQTVHYNFAIGNLPDSLTTKELAIVFRECWVDKAGIGNDDIWLQEANKLGNIGWLNYITKEAEKGNIETWDFVNTQIPYVALEADLS